jgi:hypothetical protein
MNKKTGMRAVIAESLFNKAYVKHVKNGNIKPFDEEFYSQFDNMYYNGLPIYYYMEEMSMGKCYDASAILGLAIGKNANICRGELKTMSAIDGVEFGHGWVEVGDMVYDTTWKIILSKKLYYKIFGAKLENSRDYDTFFTDCKGMSDWTIRSKEWYEENWSPSNLLVFQVRQLMDLKLKYPTISEKKKSFCEKVLRDLPNCTLSNEIKMR